MPREINYREDPNASVSWLWEGENTTSIFLSTSDGQYILEPGDDVELAREMFYHPFVYISEPTYPADDLAERIGEYA